MAEETIAGYDADGNWIGGSNSGGLDFSGINDQDQISFGVGQDTADTTIAGYDSSGNPIYASDSNWLDTISGTLGSLGSAGSSIANWIKNNPGTAATLGGLGGVLYDQNRNRDPIVQTQSTTSSKPEWLINAAKDAMGHAYTLPGYEALTFAPNTLLRNTDVASYMNPFLKATWAPQANRMKEDAAIELNALRAKGGADAWGTRGALLENLAQQRAGQRYDEAEARALNQGFNTAMGMASQDIQGTTADYNKVYQSPFTRQAAYNSTLGALGSVAPTTQTTSTVTQNPRPDLMTQLAGVGALTKGASMMNTTPAQTQPTS